MRELPFAVDDPERDVFVWRASAEVQKHRLVVAGLLDDLVCRRLRLVDEVGIEDIELQTNVNTDPTGCESDLITL